MPDTKVLGKQHSRQVFGRNKQQMHLLCLLVCAVARCHPALLGAVPITLRNSSRHYLMSLLAHSLRLHQQLAAWSTAALAPANLTCMQRWQSWQDQRSSGSLSCCSFMGPCSHLLATHLSTPGHVRSTTWGPCARLTGSSWPPHWRCTAE